MRARAIALLTLSLTATATLGACQLVAGLTSLTVTTSTGSGGSSSSTVASSVTAASSPSAASSAHRRRQLQRGQQLERGQQPERRGRAGAKAAGVETCPANTMSGVSCKLGGGACGICLPAPAMGTGGMGAPACAACGTFPA